MRNQPNDASQLILELPLGSEKDVSQKRGVHRDLQQSSCTHTKTCQNESMDSDSEHIPGDA